MPEGAGFSIPTSVLHLHFRGSSTIYSPFDGINEDGSALIFASIIPF